MYNTQTKYWYLTSYETEEPPYLDSMTYPIAGRETCPDTGNKHRQCYTELKTKQRMSFSKNHDLTAALQAGGELAAGCVAIVGGRPRVGTAI